MSEIRQKNHEQAQQNINNRNRNLNTVSNSDLMESTPAPIRVTYDNQLGNSASQDVLDVIIKGMEISIKYIQDTMYVFPLKSNIVIEDISNITNGQEGFCIQSSIKENYTVSDSDKTTGIANSDFHLYITVTNDTEENYLAYAAPCQWINDRPTVGMVHFNQAWFDQTYDANHLAYFEENIETTLHEIYHAMGFSGDMIQYFRSKSTGNSFSTQFVEEKILIKQKLRGISTFVLRSPTIRALTQEHFGCSEAEGAQLENEGDEGSIAGHWERLMFYNEVMNPTAIQSDSVTSGFTLGFFKDSGWYPYIDMSYAENIQWGKNQGCEFLQSENCPDSEKHNEISADRDQRCTFHHFGLGTGHVETFTDTCHVNAMFSDDDCTNPALNVSDADITLETRGEQSKCFKSNITGEGQTRNPDNEYNFRCYEYECTRNVLRIKFSNGSYVDCNKNNDNGVRKELTDSSNTVDGVLICPDDLDLFCEFPSPCENYCSENGYCLRQNGINECQCLDGYADSSCSTTCNGVLDADGNCVNSCPTGYYKTRGTNECKECNGCDYCNGPLSSNCQECPQGEYSSNGSCVTSCPPGEFANKETGDCESCSSSCGSNGCFMEADNCIVQPVLYADFDAKLAAVQNDPTGGDSDMYPEVKELDFGGDDDNNNNNNDDNDSGIILSSQMAVLVFLISFYIFI